MIISKIALSRRTFVRGMGAIVALPLLDAMVPALTLAAKTAANPVRRLGFWGISNGMHAPDFRPKTEGNWKGRDGNGLGEDKPYGNGLPSLNLLELESGLILKPLDAFKDQQVVFQGLSNVAADSKDVGGGSHARGYSAFLSGMRPHRTEGSDLYLGKTVDQYAADVLGADTPLRSLEMGLESSYAGGNCDQGYACAYINTFSWRSATVPNPMENNPRLVFERLFGDGGSTPARLKQLKQDGSILDWVMTDIAHLQGTLGPHDRNTVNEYLDTLRDVERRIQMAERQSETTPLPDMAQPVGVPESHDDHAKLMVDLMHLAYQADITRVISFSMSRELFNGRSYDFIGVPSGHHSASHHQGLPAQVAGYSKISAYYVSILGELLKKMRETPDGDGTLLDHSIFLFGGGFGDGDLHSPHNLPVMLVGGGGGSLKGGRYLRFPIDTPMMNLGLSLLDKVGVELESLGDSTGRLADV